MQQGKRLKGLDDFKWIAAALVVAIHTSPLETINQTADFLLTRVLARLSVPFFFMVTGYFVLYGSYIAGKFVKIGRAVIKLFLLYLGITLLYLPVRLYQFVGEEAVFSNSTLGEILLHTGKVFFFDGTYYHLWYLPAAGLGLLIAWVCLRMFGRKGAFLCTGLLYLIGLMGDSYYGLAEKIPLLRNFYETMFQAFSYTRNGLFFAPLFLLLGYEAAAKTQFSREAAVPIEEDHNTLRENKIFFYSTLLLMCGEGLILHILGWQRHDSMYLFLPFCMKGLFSILLTKESGIFRKDLFVKAKRKTFYEKGPMLLYFLHPAVILAVRGFVKMTGLTFILTVSPVYYIAVLGGSLILVYICLLIWDKFRFR